MKIPIDGRSPSVLAKGEFLGGRYSPDGKRIAAYAAESDRQGIAILSSADGAPIRRFDLAPHGSLSYYDYSMLRWTPDGRALTYPLLAGSAMNLWRQPIAGGPPKQLTHLDELIFAYDWSPDGKRLAISHGKTWSDVVLISNFH
jgi:Tol biopolymer transport system component